MPSDLARYQELAFRDGLDVSTMLDRFLKKLCQLSLLTWAIYMASQAEKATQNVRRVVPTQPFRITFNSSGSLTGHTSYLVHMSNVTIRTTSDANVNSWRKSNHMALVASRLAMLPISWLYSFSASGRDSTTCDREPAAEMGQQVCSKLVCFHWTLRIMLYQRVAHDVSVTSGYERQ